MTRSDSESGPFGLWVDQAAQAGALAALRDSPAAARARSLWLSPGPRASGASLVGVAAACTVWHSMARVVIGPVPVAERPLLRLAEDLATLSCVSGGRAGVILAASDRGGTKVLASVVALLRAAWDGQRVEARARHEGPDAGSESEAVEIHPCAGGAERVAIFAECDSSADRSEARSLGIGAWVCSRGQLPRVFAADGAEFERLERFSPVTR